ncbi:MAG: hypothetical protein WCZ66_04990 [Sphingomonadaceae bacterium]
MLMLAGAVSCAPAPLYTGKRVGPAVTGGEIPRDARGEPVWSQIEPPRTLEDTGLEPPETREKSPPVPAPSL